MGKEKRAFIVPYRGPYRGEQFWSSRTGSRYRRSLIRELAGPSAAGLHSLYCFCCCFYLHAKNFSRVLWGEWFLDGLMLPPSSNILGRDCARGREIERNAKIGFEGGGGGGGL